MKGIRRSVRGRLVWLLAVAVVAAVLPIVAAAPSSTAAEAEPPVTVERSEIPDVEVPADPDPLPNAGPLSPPGEPTSPDAAPTPADVALDRARETGERVEVTSLRSESTTTFAEPSGALTKEIAAGPVRVQSGSGGWEPVNPTLRATASGVEPTAVAAEVSLSAGGTEPLVSITDPATAERDETVTVDMPGSLPAPRLSGNKATYPDALAGADVVVTANTVGAEVSVVIGSRDEAKASYDLDLGVQNLSVTQDQHDNLMFKDVDGKQTGFSPAPVMFDSTPGPMAGVSANQGRVGSQLIHSGGRTILRLTPGAEYLASARYPVTIDPATDLTAAVDTTLWESVPTQSGNSNTSLLVGYGAWTARTRSFIRFDTGGFAGQTVQSATLSLYHNASSSCTTSDVAIHRSDPVSTTSTWSSMAGAVGARVTSKSVTGDASSCPAQVGYKTFNVTTAAQAFADAGGPSGTLAVLADNETDPNQLHGFASRETTNPPKLAVTYNIHPDTPTDLSPDPGTYTTTLKPTLKAKVTCAACDNNVDLIFSLRDSTGTTEITTEVVEVAPGQTGSWQIPENNLRAGWTYQWSVKACTGSGTLAVACNKSPAATRILNVHRQMATGTRSFFTYDRVGLTDRSNLAVNVATGNVQVNATDLALAGAGPSLGMTRTYNSRSANSLMYGANWAGSYTNTVRLGLDGDESGDLVFVDATGNAARIAKNDDGTWTPTGDLDARFTDTGGFALYALQFNHSRNGHQAGDTLYFCNGQTSPGPNPACTPSRIHKLWGMTNRNNRQISLTYNSSDVITNVSDTHSRPVNYTFTGGRITKLEDPNGGSYGVTGDTRSVTYTYTGDGALDTVTDAVGNVTDYDYVGSALTKITLPGGRIVNITYDGLRRATSVSRIVAGVTETTTYNYNGDVESGGLFTTTVTDARGKTTTYRADYAGRVKSATNHALETISRTFDVNSNVIEMLDSGNTVPATFEFDELNNATRSVTSTGVTTSAKPDPDNTDGYSTNGLWPYQMVDSTDAQGKVSTYGYDPIGNSTSSANALGQATSATYQNGSSNASACASSGGAKPGQMCTATDRKTPAATTTYVYWPNGDLKRVNNPAPLGDPEMTYDNISRVRTRTDGAGNLATVTYDKNDRVTAITYPGSRSVTYSYDGVGNVTTRIDTTSGSPQTWVYTYDEANRIRTVNGPGSLNDVTYAYDKVGNPLTVTDPGGTTTYTYSDLNQPVTITDPDNNVTTYTYQYGHSSWLQQIQYPNGARTNYTRDSDGRTETLKNRTANGAIVDDFTYDWTEGPAERALLQTITTPTVNTRYTYDNASRLTSAVTRNNNNGATVGDTWGYGYDGNSNRTRVTQNAAIYNHAFNAADQQTTANWTFDGNGSLTNGGASGYTAATYNSLGQTNQLTVKNQAAVAQTYGGAGQSRWLSTGTRQFGSTGAGITTILDGSTATRFTRDPNGRLISVKNATGRYYYFHDARGSVIGLTDPAGARVQTYSYEPYGRIDTTTTVGTPVNQPFRWNSEYAYNDYDYKIGARYYDSSQARWTQTDPIPGQPRYAYALGDPINNTDPSGMDTCGEDWNIGGAVDCASKASGSVESGLHTLNTWLSYGLCAYGSFQAGLTSFTVISSGAILGGGAIANMPGAIVGFGVGVPAGLYAGHYTAEAAADLLGC